MPAVVEQVAGVTTDEFLADYSAVCPIHIDIARAGIDSLAAFHRGKPFDEKLLSPLADIERRWYDSLDAGAPDFSIYGDQWYFADLWVCWELASKSYLEDVAGISGADSLFSTALPVVDLGCGLGHTTAALAEMFPRARVIGTNIDGTKQWEFCRTMADRHGFGLVSDIAEIAPPVAFVFASEYFEHIQDPVGHLVEVLDHLRPAVFCVANAFTVQWMGHFRHVDTMDGLFRKTLRQKGYRPFKTGFANGRPEIWVFE